MGGCDWANTHLLTRYFAPGRFPLSRKYLLRSFFVADRKQRSERGAFLKSVISEYDEVKTEASIIEHLEVLPTAYSAARALEKSLIFQANECHISPSSQATDGGVDVDLDGNSKDGMSNSLIDSWKVYLVLQ